FRNKNKSFQPHHNTTFVQSIGLAWEEKRGVAFCGGPGVSWRYKIVKKVFMVKKIIFLSLLCVFTASSDVHKLITSSDFTEKSKQVLSAALAIWISVARENNIPLDRGLAKIFLRMHNDGIEKLINDQKALEKANELYAAFLESPCSKLI